jgi:hypothetical protein
LVDRGSAVVFDQFPREITGIETRTVPKVLMDRIPSLLIVEELAFLFV